MLNHMYERSFIGLHYFLVNITSGRYALHILTEWIILKHILFIKVHFLTGSCKDFGNDTADFVSFAYPLSFDSQS